LSGQAQVKLFQMESFTSRLLSLAEDQFFFSLAR
jgi:hypothetical protein